MSGERGAVGLAGDAGVLGVAKDVSSAVGLLIALAVEDGTDGFRAAIDEQLDAVAAWWQVSSPGQPGFVQMLSRAPRNRHDVERFLDHSGIRDVEADVPLVVYVTGHGLVGSSAKHYLLLQETDRARLLATALRTNEIVAAALDSCARDVLVIVNLCEAAGIGPELLELERDLAMDRTTDCTLNVLATTGPRTQVLGREFALILREAHEWLGSAGGITRPYLTMSEFSDALQHATTTVNMKYRRKLRGPRPLLTGQLGVPTAALPNPGYRLKPAVVAQSRQEVAASYEELEYWLEKASGRTSVDDPGWYFSGRQALNRKVTAFLQGPPGVLVVTGTAASGKSAVLGRAVTLTDPVFRTSERYGAAVRHCPADTVPDEGAVTVAVTARNRDSLSLLRAIGRGLGLEPVPGVGDEVRRWQAGLRTFLDAAGPVVTVVVDAVDEAYEPVACVRDVLAPLARHAGFPFVPAQVGVEATVPRRRRLRLVLGVRSSSPGSSVLLPADGNWELLAELQATFPGAQVERTDADGVEADVADYVRALIEGEAAWAGQDLPEVSALVAAGVDGSFLDARLAAEQLRMGGPALLEDAGWAAGLDRGTVGLLQADLARVAEEALNTDEALALLRATAFALGRGIAWGEVWPAVAAAVLQAPIESADAKIGKLLGGRLSGYLTHDTEDDRLVYRPAHDRLAGILRRWHEAGVTQGGGKM